MKVRTRTFLLFALAVGLIVPISVGRSAVAHAQTQVGGSEELAALWVSALDRHDVEGALALLDDAFLTTENVEGDVLVGYEGKGEIRAVLQDWAAQDLRVQLVSAPHIVNGTLTWMEARSTSAQRDRGMQPVEYSADAIVENGKIRSLIYTPNPGSPEQGGHSGGQSSATATSTTAGSGSVNMGMPRTGATRLLPASVLNWLALLAALCLAAGLTLRRITLTRRDTESK